VQIYIELILLLTAGDDGMTFQCPLVASYFKNTDKLKITAMIKNGNGTN